MAAAAKTDISTLFLILQAWSSYLSLDFDVAGGFMRKEGMNVCSREEDDESDCGVQLENTRHILGPMTLGTVHRRTNTHDGTNGREIWR
jgi:hypothetical protein